MLIRPIYSFVSMVVLCFIFSQALYAKDQGLVVYQIDDFSNSSISSNDKQANILSKSGFSNQMIYFFFTLSNETENDLKNVSISRDITAQYTDIYAELFLIHSWYQYTLPVTPRRQSTISHFLVPELMIKNDTNYLFDHDSENNTYLAPDMPDDISTNIPAGKYKYFSLKVKLPDVKIKTKITIYAKIHHKNKIIKTIPFEVIIFPYHLPASKKYKALYFLPFLNDIELSDEKVDQIKRQLKDIHDHGFNGITIRDDNVGNVVKLASLAQETGVGETVVIMPHGNNDEYLEDVIHAIDDLIPELFVMTVDEPNNSKKIKTHLRRSQRWRKKNISTYAPMRLEWEKKIRDKDSLNWVNYNYRENFHENLEDVASPHNTIRTYYWQIYMEMPVLNRYLSGFYLYYTGLDGIFPYAYRHEFYNDLPYAGDLRFMGNRRRQQQDINQRRKYYYTTYPSINGPVPTLQWEALIAGDNDLRLCFLIDALVESLAINGYSDKSQAIKSDFQKKMSDLVKFYPSKRLTKYRNYEQELNRSILHLYDWVIDTLKSNLSRINFRQAS